MTSLVPRHRISRALAAVGTALAAAAGGLALTAPSAGAAPSTSYVALGDSYASGVGTGSYLRDGTSCKRSVYAYPSLNAAALGLNLNFRACSGATVSDVTSAQLPALSAATGYVTVSAGGNDLGFAEVVSTCAGSNTTSCLNAVTNAQNFIRTTLPGRLGGLYSSIKAAAPNATFVVVGYPRLFNGRDCSIWTSFTSAEMTALNQTADQLNGAIAGAAGRAGAAFADPTSVFGGHAVCDRSPWVNNVNIFALRESFHPNRAGQQSGYAAVSRPLLGAGSAVAAQSPAQVRAAAEASAQRLTSDAVRYAAVDRTITPGQFRLPDLSPR